MRVIVFVKATEDSEKGTLPTPEMMMAMAQYNAQLVAAGILRPDPNFGAGLKPTSHAKRIAFDGAERTVIDGPFGAPNDLVAGYWIWNVKDMDEAVMWAKRCPNPMPGPSEIEIRPYYEMEDFL